MDMFTPSGIAGISLHLFGLPLLAAGGAAALLGLVAWIAVARAANGKARLGASRLPTLAVGAVVGGGMTVGLLATTRATFASLSGTLDWVVFLGPVLAAAAGAMLLAWPVFALLRPASGRGAEKPAVEADGLRQV